MSGSDVTGANRIRAAIAHPCRRFVFAQMQEHQAAGVRQIQLDSARSARDGAVLSESDFRLAELFDGQSTSEQIIVRARDALGLSLSRAQLEGFAEQLTVSGLMERGAREPLPLPAQSDDERVALGWTGAAVSAPEAKYNGPLPPSTLAGSRSAPAYLGGLTGLLGSRRGNQARFVHLLPPGPWIALGRCLIWPTVNRWALLAQMMLAVGAVLAVHAHWLEWRRSGLDLLNPYALVAVALASAFLVNLVSAAGRAAAVARYTPERVRIGVVTEYGRFWVPRLFVDTGGAAERSRLSDRMRIIGSALVASINLMVLAVFIWFLTADTIPGVAAVAVGVTLAAAFSIIVRANPTAERDGYFLLATALGVPDLRTQAVFAIWDARRAWFNQSRRLNRSSLLIYVLAVAAFWGLLVFLVTAFVGKWVTAHYGGLGFLALLGFVGVSMNRQYHKVTLQRSDMGRVKKPWWPPSRRTMIIAAVVALLCVIPYPYTPSGDFTVLPSARADARTLVAGEVRKVVVKEGDLVKAGQVLAQLDDSEERARVESGKAQVAQLQADLSLLQKGARPEEIDVARQKVVTLQRRFDFSKAQADRLKRAYQQKGVTFEEYDRARGVAEVNEQELMEAKRNLDLISSPTRKDNIDSIEAQIARVKADLDYSETLLRETAITAPIAGRVVSGSLDFAVGTFLHRGDKLAVIEDTSQLMAEIQLPEAIVGDVKVGASAKFKVWAFPERSFRGNVDSIAPAAEDGPYGKVVRVRLKVDDPDMDELKSGMTGTAKAFAGWHLSGFVFTRALSRFLFVEVWSWLP